MDLMDIQAVELKLQDVTVTPIPMRRSSPYDQSYQSMQQQQHTPISQGQMSPLILTSYQSSNNNISNLPSPLSSFSTNSTLSLNNQSSLSKYAQLLLVIEEMGRDLRPTYSGSRSSAERLKRGIVHARILVGLYIIYEYIYNILFYSILGTGVFARNRKKC
jgi:hypothetical protein